MRFNDQVKNVQDLIKNYFTESIQTQIVMAESLGSSIEKAANIIVEGLLNGNKIMGCGNGSAAANIQSFTSRLITSLDIERPSIPAKIKWLPFSSCYFTLR